MFTWQPYGSGAACYNNASVLISNPAVLLIKVWATRQDCGCCASLKSKDTLLSVWCFSCHSDCMPCWTAGTCSLSSTHLPILWKERVAIELDSTLCALIMCKDRGVQMWRERNSQDSNRKAQIHRPYSWPLLTQSPIDHQASCPWASFNNTPITSLATHLRNAFHVMAFNLLPITSFETFTDLCTAAHSEPASRTWLWSYTL